MGALVIKRRRTTMFEALSQLGIASINLTSDNNVNVLADGSEILGETTYTTASGTTGTAADASFAYDVNGWRWRMAVKSMLRAAVAQARFEPQRRGGAPQILQPNDF